MGCLGFPGARVTLCCMITSVDNERVRQVRALQSRRQARRKAGRFVIEGVRLVREAALAGIAVEEVFYTDTFAVDSDGVALLDSLSCLGARLLAVDETVMSAMSDTRTPQGILAVLPTVDLPIPAEATFILVIDGVSDPGNMGTVMRTAASAGVPLMITTAGTVDLTNPKVVRSAMGAHFRLPTQPLSWEGIGHKLTGHAVFLASASGGAPYYRVNWTQPCALIVSEEAHGPSHQALRLAHAHVTIPMPGGTESLNVAVAAGILIFEMVRQRTEQGLLKV